MSGDHPITWCKTTTAGGAWYTGLGHTEASYTDPNFTRMLLGGLRSPRARDGRLLAAHHHPAAHRQRLTLRARANNQYVSAPNATTALIANETPSATTRAVRPGQPRQRQRGAARKGNGQYVARRERRGRRADRQPGHRRRLGDLPARPQLRRHGEPAGHGEQPLRRRRQRGRVPADRQPDLHRSVGEVRPGHHQLTWSPARSPPPHLVVVRPRAPVPIVRGDHAARTPGAGPGRSSRR